MIKVLIVDDEAEALLSLSRALKALASNLIIDGVVSAAQALDCLGKSEPQVVLMDLSLNSKQGVESGFDLLNALVSSGSNCKVIVLTGHANIEYGVRALNMGAAHFLEKPPDLQHLLALIRDCANQTEIFKAYQSSAKNSHSLILNQEIVGGSREVEELRNEIVFAATTNQSILLLGETGTGKTLCASLIHQLSSRANNKFICYAPAYHSADLVNSDLYGHLKGAFTGAHESRTGLLQEADRGTFFLDEIDELPQDTQISLLRVLQNKTFRSLGSNKEERSDFRLISASNREPKELLDKNKIREDFFHRIAHRVIQVPALRNRVTDIKELSEACLRSLTKREQLNVFYFSDLAIKKLEQYKWPGNIRELHAVVEGAAYLAQFNNRVVIEESDLRIESKLFGSESVEPQGFHALVENYKKNLVEQAMKVSGGNQVQAAKSLGLDRSSLRRILGRE